MKGILFQTDMIKAIVEGRKTHTRRVSGLKEINKEPDRWDYEYENNGVFTFSTNGAFSFIEIKPRYQVGETVYIKEAWRIESFMDGEPLLFGYKDGTTKEENELSDTFRYESWYERVCIQATEDARIAFNKGLVKQDAEGTYRWDIGNSPCRWYSPLFMPAWAARYFKKITSVNPQRLQEIDYFGARAEGILSFNSDNPDSDGGLGYNRGAVGLPMRYESVAAFMDLWNSINPEYPFEMNPWVFDYGI